MDYEKKYKEALSRARQFSEHPLLEDSSNIVEYIFPELKEPEDEKMLREIKRYIKEQGDKPTGLPNGSVAVADMLAWLEKQGEKEKFIEKELDNIRGYREEAIRRLQELENQGEQESAEWHNEDEQNLNACLSYIPDEYLRRWLKDTIHVKYDKYAWSEEDENLLKAITYTVVRNSFYKECMGISNEKMIDWLKSLKDRVQPQWKPKDIYLEALRCVINGNNLDVIALKDLFEQLKKL